MSELDSLSQSDRETLLKNFREQTARRGRKSRRWPFDLFGEMPVSYEECREWVRAVAPRFYESRREGWYIVQYQVAAKVAAWKASGRPMPQPDARLPDPLGFAPYRR